MILHEVAMPRSRTAAIGWRFVLDSGAPHGTRGLRWQKVADQLSISLGLQ
jgi:hypothetical protein